MKLEAGKVKAFLSTAGDHNYGAEWVQEHDAAGIDHTVHDGITRTRAQPMEELTTGKRKLYKLMWRILVSMVMVPMLASFVKAQEASGEAAEKVKKQIDDLEQERIRAILESQSSYLAWHKRYDADEIVHVVPDGTVETKAQLMAEVAKGERKMYALKSSSQRVRVYGDGGDGTTAVVTYISEGTIDLHGQRSSNRRAAIDVWVKQGGQWYVAVHSVHPVPPEAHSSP